MGPDSSRRNPVGSSSCRRCIIITIAPLAGSFSLERRVLSIQLFAVLRSASESAWSGLTGSSSIATSLPRPMSFRRCWWRSSDPPRPYGTPRLTSVAQCREVNHFVDVKPILDRRFFLKERTNTADGGAGPSAVLDDPFDGLPRLLEIRWIGREPLYTCVALGSRLPSAAG